MWFILVLSMLPPVLSIMRFLRPGKVGASTTALFAVLAVLQMLATDSFVNITDSRTADAFDEVRKGNQVAVVGFAVMSAMSLLAIVVDSFVDGDTTRPVEARSINGNVGGHVQVVDVKV